MTNDTLTPTAEFHRKDAVRLLVQQRGVKAGSIGHILGTFAGPEPTFAVCFIQDRIRSLEVRPDEIVLVPDVRAAA